MDAPLDDLTRAYRPGLQTLDGGGDALPTLYGHFTTFDQWSEIHSYFEGDFLERTIKGAFSKTIKENRAGIRVLYDHGHDPQLGNKPLGPIDDLREEDFGPYYEVPLIDTDYNRGFVIPALDAGLLGASYRFRIIREEWNDEPGKSDHNPKGLPERTIKEARLYEFGPVTFPAFAGATAKLRSTSDDYHDLSTLSPRAAHRAPADDSAAPPDPDAAPVAPQGLTPAQRETALRAVLL
jgi:HK97 family phage prohead protease